MRGFKKYFWFFTFLCLNSQIFSVFAQPDMDCEQYRLLASEDSHGFYSWLDMQTFRPAIPPGKEGRYLTEEDIGEMLEWRSSDGIPWSTWVYQKDHSLASREIHNIKTALGIFVIPEETYKVFWDFVLEKNGIHLSPEETKLWHTNGRLPDRLFEKLEVPPEFFWTRWFRENVSAVIWNIPLAIMETYAWYSSPSYEKGSLPKKLEAGLAILEKGKSPSFLEELAPRFQCYYKNALKMIREGVNIPASQKPVAGYYDHLFFKRKTVRPQVEFFKEILSAMKMVKREPSTAKEGFERISALLNKRPESLPKFDVEVLKTFLQDLEIIILNQGKPGRMPVSVDGSTTQTLEEFRINFKENLDSNINDYSFFIKAWSSVLE